MILDATTKTMQVKLGAAHTTTALDVTSWWEDLTVSSFLTGETDTTTNGTTAVTAVAAPANAQTQRRVKRIVVYNADSVAQTVTVQYNNNGTARVLCKRTLNPGDSLEYS